MAEPTSTSSGALALASGMAGAILVGLGISWALLTWGALGCIVGLSWAPKVGRARALSLFSASALLSAKGGAVLAVFWLHTGVDAAQGIAAGLGILFHPLLTAIVTHLPAAIAKRFA